MDRRDVLRGVVAGVTAGFAGCSDNSRTDARETTLAEFSIGDSVCDGESVAPRIEWRTDGAVVNAGVELARGTYTLDPSLFGPSDDDGIVLEIDADETADGPTQMACSGQRPYTATISTTGYTPEEVDVIHKVGGDSTYVTGFRKGD